MAITQSAIRNSNGINFTYVVDSSSDWSGITNSTYFKDLSDGLIYFKNSSGTVLSMFNLFTGGTVTGLTINGNLTVTGTTTMPNRVAFRVVGSGTTSNLTTTQNGDGVLNGNNFAVDFQQGNNLNTTNGIFTATTAGLYQVNLVCRNSGYSSGISQLCVLKNSSVIIMVEFASSSSMNHTGGSTVVKMAVNDTLKLQVLAGQINFDGNDNWSVAFIG